MTLDPASDPDRYDPTKDAAPAGPLDPDLDPDRFDRRSPTLPELVGDGAYEDERDISWVFGLLGVFGFLALFTLAIYLL